MYREPLIPIKIRASCHTTIGVTDDSLYTTTMAAASRVQIDGKGVLISSSGLYSEAARKEVS